MALGIPSPDPLPIVALRTAVLASLVCAVPSTQSAAGEETAITTARPGRLAGHGAGAPFFCAGSALHRALSLEPLGDDTRHSASPAKERPCDRR
jgi:hypothetical protein